jgi:3-phenylpropionate/cinnamic acid dioxygenase small subunit
VSPAGPAATEDGGDPAALDYKALVQDDRIHASLYTDRRIFEDEMERIFSHVYDDRARLETRVRMLQTGHRPSQEPASPMHRLISNVEVPAAAAGELHVESNFLLGELAVQAGRELHWWIGRTTHARRRRRAPDELQEGRARQRRRAAAESGLPDLTRRASARVVVRGSRPPAL